ncbi:MAG: hypothetical protein ACXWIT_31300 [Burkholderiales bacterium]
MDPNVGWSIAFDRNHFTIVKPSNRTDDVYQWVAARLLEQDLLGTPVEWGGGWLGDLVADIQGAYAQGNTGYLVSYASSKDEEHLARLWVSRRVAPVTGAGWDNLLAPHVFSELAIKHR